MNLPAAARAKREAAMRRQTQLHERAMQGDQGAQAAMMRQQQFAGLNRPTTRQFRDRREDFLTSQELELAMEARVKSGKSFRNIFFLGIGLLMLLLAFFKYDEEMNLEVPQLESGRGFGEVEDPVDAPEGAAAGETPVRRTGSAYATTKEEIDAHLKTLGVTGNFIPTEQERIASAEPKATEEDDEEESSERARLLRQDPDLARRLEMQRVKREVRKRMEEHNEEFGQLVACGRSCEAKHQQVTAAFEAIDSVIPRELFKTLLDEKDTRKARKASPEELRAALERKQAEAAKIEDEEIRTLVLSEAKAAYDILISPESRTYYLMYGTKPREALKRTSARHGGWGQEFLLGTYKVRMIFAIIEYFATESGWPETIVLSIVVGLLLARVPSIVSQTMKMVDVLEQQEQLDEMTEQRDAGN